jgi:hypothetical protein
MIDPAFSMAEWRACDKNLPLTDLFGLDLDYCPCLGAAPGRVLMNE